MVENNLSLEEVGVNRNKIYHKEIAIRFHYVIYTNFTVQSYRL